MSHVNNRVYYLPYLSRYLGRSMDVYLGMYFGIARCLGSSLDKVIVSYS